MRAAFWTPLPPDATDIGVASYDLLAALVTDFAVVAVVRDSRAAARAIAPPGVEVIPRDQYRSEDVDCDVYVMGDELEFHDYVHAQALRRPGVLILDDLALVNFYGALCGGFKTSIFLEEARLNYPELTKLPAVETDGGSDIDRGSLVMTRRLVDASLSTVVHSDRARSTVLARSPQAIVHAISPAIRLLEQPTPRVGPAVFAVLSGISGRQQTGDALRAFAEIHRAFPGSRFLIAGPDDDPGLTRRLKEFVVLEGLLEDVTVLGDVVRNELDELLLSCDAVVELHQPTLADTTTLAMRAFGAGRLVIASDVPEYQQFDERYCLRVATEPHRRRNALIAAMARVASDPAGARAAGHFARERVRQETTPIVVEERYRNLIRDVAASPTRGALASASLEEHPGVNAIASWASTTGLTEAARRAVLGLLDAGVDVAIEDFDFHAPQESHRFPRQFKRLPVGRPHSIDVIFVNVNELQLMPEDYLRRSDHPSYAIGYWYWELPAVPSHIVHQLQRVDEVWVASEFVRESFGQYVSVPIRVMPCVVQPEPDPTWTRDTFGLPADACVFLFNFDANSTLARKNPLAVIDAFRKAFPPSERGRGALLVLKSLNLDQLEEFRALIVDELATVDGVLIEDDLTPGAMASLIASCDVYVSLHRAEGFGLGMAEAMYLGRPVIATAYSGNLEFTSAANSCLVGYDIRQINATDLRFNPGAEHVYQPGMLWSEPDTAQAATWMRRLFERPDQRARIGAAGQRVIRERYNVGAAGRALRDRLEEIHSAMNDSMTQPR